KLIRPLRITGDTTLTCDVVIVGSGAGGGVVAAELAARGKDVLVLEKGGYRNEADFTHEEGEALQTMYDAEGLLATRDLGLLVLQGSTLGGGTVINYTTSFPTPDSLRAAWAREHRLPHFTSAEFTRSLDAVSQRIAVNTAHASPSGRDRVLIRGLEQLQWHHGLLPRDVRGCTQDDSCGYCGFGCRRGAKQSTLITYLQDAAQRGARVVVDCHVRRVMIERGMATGVEATSGIHRVTVRANAVVVAGGAIHSPALLLRDVVGGRVTVDRDGNAIVDYRVSRYDAAHHRHAIAAAAELLEAAGAREIWVPLARLISYRPGTANARQDWLRRVESAGWGPNQLLLVSFHQMASCRMGDDARSSVVDAEHRVWGIRGLYGADASVVPTSSGVNPMLTVIGIAH